MAITANFNPRDAVRSKMDAFRARFEKALLLVLNELGAELAKIAGTSASKYTLAVVAGMEYAAYVEAKGYNVLIPAELQANKEFVPRMKELFAKADAKLKEMMK